MVRPVPGGAPAAHGPRQGPVASASSASTTRTQPENALRFLGTFGNPYAAVGVDPTGRAAIDWGVYGVPESFIVGPDGTIRHKQIGPLTPGQLARFRAELRKAKAPG